MTTVCPHCHLPPTLPDVCTPELNDVIESHIADDWQLLNRGVEIGQQMAVDDKYAAFLKRIEQERDRQQSAAAAARDLHDPDSAERERTHRFTAGVVDSLLWE